jgi:hypothetical protein
MRKRQIAAHPIPIGDGGRDTGDKLAVAALGRMRRTRRRNAEDSEARRGI